MGSPEFVKRSFESLHLDVIRETGQTSACERTRNSLNIIFST